MLKVLDLFSGIGGFSLGLERTGGFETVAFCEINPFCQKVLKKHWPDVPIYNDVRSLDYDGSVDVITGGYPCQPFSVAGKRRAEKDQRHLWPEMFRQIKKHKPRWVIAENVKGHINKGLDRVLSDLESVGYAAETHCISAKSIGANHNRERIWIVANAAGNGFYEGQIAGGNGQADDHIEKGQKKNINNERRGSLRSILQKSGYSPWRWGVKPGDIRVDDGLSNRVDRLRSLGNAVVPQIPEIIGYAILEAEKLRENG